MKNGFDVSELTDFGREIVEVAVNDMPKIAKSFMKGEARHLKNKAAKKAKSEVGTKTGNYVKGFKVGKKVYGYADAKYNVIVRNTAPHAHLIEEGHDIVTKSGQKVGYAPGKHILENTAVEFESQFAKDIENKLAKKVIEEMEK